jgi:uncharacterized membrane protein YdbT with pleckstrin-like domain
MEPEVILYEGSPAVLGSVSRLVIAIATLGIAWLWFWIKTSNIRYLITSQRIVIESGIFSRRTEALEVYSIDDIQLEKPLNQRLMGTGNMRLLTRDATTQSVYLERLQVDVRQLYEQMRPHIQSSRQKFRVWDEDVHP